MRASDAGDYLTVEAGFRVRPLETRDTRAAFSCGKPELDRYLKQFTRRDTNRDVTRAYVLVELATDRVAGYYTLAMTGVVTADLPAELQQRLPYPYTPAVLIGRLAIDQSFQRRGLGKRLLADIFYRCLDVSRQVAAAAIVVDAIDDDAARFYESFDFRPFPDQPLRLYITLQTVRAATA